MDPTKSLTVMHPLPSAFEDVPYPRAENARHGLDELHAIAFVSLLFGATSCAEMRALGCAEESVFSGFLKLKRAGRRMTPSPPCSG